MTKRDLIEIIAQKAGMRREEAEDFFYMFFKCLIDSLKEREKVKISGFGSFYVKEIGGKKGKKLKEEIDIIFKPLGKFKKL